MSSTRSGGRAAANAGGEKKPEEEHDDDEVYQYPRQGLGPVFASIESLLRCAICGGLSEPPVSLPCCQQTFCSLCIRQYLDSTTPRCPCCRAASASNQLLMCKELRSICAIWKRSRQAILAAAVVSSDAAASAGGAAAGAAAATTTAAAAAATDSVPSGRRRVCAVGSGQGRDGGGSKMAKLYYHQLTEKVLKQKLLDVGLPVTGGKVAMIARHKRLALLDAASGDREVPVPRRELIRQVASWEREKDREKQAVRSGAGGILSASASVSASASLGQSADGAGDGSVPAEAEKIVIPKKMQAGFAALIANARKNAKKRPSTSSGSEAGIGGGTAGGADNGSDSKRARVSPELESGSSGGGGAGVCNGSGSARPHRSDSSSLGGGGRSVSGGAAVANGGGAGIRILGVAGRMVRTRGPWRCVFSNGRAPLPLAAAAAPPPSIRHAEETQKVETPTGATTSTEGGSCQGSSGRTMSSNGHVDASASSENGRGGGRAGASGGESAGGVDGGDSGGGGGGGEKSTSTSHGEMDAMPAEGVRQGGLVYLNTITGEAVHEPPAELLTRAEEADSAGEYLVFVPSRNFVEAAEAASGLSEAASAVGAAAENVLQAVADAGACSSAMKASGSGGGGNGAEAPKHRGEEEQGAQERVPLPLIAAPTPPTAVKSTAAAAAAGSSTPCGSIRSGGSSGGGAAGGGETWDRLSSLPMIDLSQGAPSAPLDVENAGGGGGGGAEAGAGVAVAVEGVAAAPAAVAAMWTCTACTLLNKARRTTCAVCSKARPKSFDAQHRAVQPASSSRSKLRLLQRRSGGGVPQSSITSFTSRPPSDANDGNGKSKAISGGGASDDVQLVSPPSSAAPVSAAGAVPLSQAPPPPSQSSVTAPISGFPTVRSQDRSSPDVYAAVAPEKPQH